jgi:hypothetical protein
MELLVVFRGVWRRRIPLLAALVVTVATFVGLGGAKPPITTAAEAWTRVAIDTHDSQLVTAAPAGAGTLAWRASLIAHLMATQSMTQQLAARLGVGSDKVGVVDPTLSKPLVSTDFASAAAKAAAADVLTPYVLNVYLADETVPVITLTAAAPDAAAAVKLAQAGAAVLESQAEASGKITSQVVTDAGVLGRQRFVVDQVAPVRWKLLHTTSLPRKATAGALFVLFAWCVGIVLVPKLARSMRARRRARALLV